MINDPSPYDGPIQRADGVRPYNMYLWDSESWWPGRERRFQCVSGRHHFGIVALMDGRWAIDGDVFAITRGEGVYATRIQALRVAAARAIRLVRWSRGWSDFHQALKGKLAADVINWYRAIVAAECGKPEPKPVTVREALPPPPVRPEAGLPLFDYVPDKGKDGGA